MEVLYLLLPLSLAFVAMIGGILWWAVFSGQYDDPDIAARSILEDKDEGADTTVPEFDHNKSPIVDSCQNFK